MFNNERINYITAVSTAILAFVAIIGLMFALVEFVEKGILSTKLLIATFVLIFIGLFVIVGIIKRWVKNV
jgi:hypothetical protein